MLEELRGKLRRIRTRLVMRSALSDGIVFRWSRRGIGNRFNERAPGWDQMVAEHEHKWFDPLDAALDRMPAGWSPGLIVDIGGGTGRAGYHLAGRYPDSDVTVVDLALKMLAFGRARQDTEQLPPVRFVAGDSAAIPIQSGIAGLAFVLNAPPNPAEMARVLRPGGIGVFAFTYGHHTPMYLDEPTSRRSLERHGFQDIQAGAGGEGTWVMGRLPE